MILLGERDCSASILPLMRASAPLRRLSSASNPAVAFGMTTAPRQRRPSAVALAAGNYLVVDQGIRRILAKQFPIVSGKAAHVAEAALAGDAFDRERVGGGRLQALTGAVQGEAARPFLRRHAIGTVENALQGAGGRAGCGGQIFDLKG